MLPSDTAGRERAAVHREDVAGDHAGGLGGQIERGAHQLVGLAHAAEGDAAHAALLVARLAMDQVADIALEPRGRDRVDPDIVRCPLDGQGPRQHHHAALARRVRDRARQADLPRDGGEVDDAATAPADHATAHDLAGEEDAGEVDGDDAAHSAWGSRPPGSGG